MFPIICRIIMASLGEIFLQDERYNIIFYDGFSFLACFIMIMTRKEGGLLSKQSKKRICKHINDNEKIL